MKFNELPIKNVKEFNDEDCYILCNIVKRNEDDEITALDKCLVPAKSFGYREEIMTIGEQNTGFVNIINKLVSNYQELNLTMMEIKKQIEDLKTSSPQNLDNILETIKDLEKRLDNNIIEL